MAYGVLLHKPDECLVKANFYIPTLTHTSTLISKSSHVYYTYKLFDEQAFILALNTIPPAISVIVEYPQSYGLDSFLKILLKLPHKIAVSFHIKEDVELWYSLRHARATYGPSIDFLIKLREKVSKSCLKRYKCLQYSAILLLGDSYDQAHYLLSKPQTPHLIIDHELALKKPVEFWQKLATPKIQAGLDLLIDPLQPLANDMDLVVYSTFQTDEIKYTQYDCAIEMAISDLRISRKKLRVLIIGAGQGPLLESALKYSIPTDQIIVVEKNKKCSAALKAISDQHENVSLRFCDIREVEDIENYDLVISELLGSFGCNEACPEILQKFVKREIIMIPQSYKSFVHPIYTGLNLTKITRPYLINLCSSFASQNPSEAFEFEHPKRNQLNQRFQKIFSGPPRETANALCGYFEATLYGPFKIGNAPHLNRLEKCDSWFPIVFPIQEQAFPLIVEVSRVSAYDLTYTWTVNGTQYGNEKHHTTKNYRITL